MTALTKFLQTLLKGVDPVTVALWLRGLVATLLSGAFIGVSDLLTQVMAQLQTSDPLVLDWRLAARTVAIATIPLVLGYLKLHTQIRTEQERTAVAADLPEGVTLEEIEATRLQQKSQ